MRSPCKISDNSDKNPGTFIKRAISELICRIPYYIIKVPGFLSELSEISHGLLIYHLATFIFSKPFDQEKILLIELWKLDFWHEKRAKMGVIFEGPNPNSKNLFQVVQMTLKKLRGISVKWGALLHYHVFVKNWVETGLLVKIFRWLSFWVWAF